MLHDVADVAGARSWKVDGSRGDADDVTPHPLRHSLAYRMLHEKEGIRSMMYETDCGIGVFRLRNGSMITSDGCEILTCGRESKTTRSCHNKVLSQRIDSVHLMESSCDHC